MTDLERYHFVRQGYLHIPGFLSPEQTRRLYRAAQDLEQDAMSCKKTSPRWKAVAPYKTDYWRNEKHGYFAHGEQANGKTVMIEDFWLYPDAFDMLIGHDQTMAYINRVIRGPSAINNSEIRIRYQGNQTGIHMGFPHGHTAKYRYNVLEGEIDCAMVRMVYFLHDVGVEDGPICFVPGSHKSAFRCPAEGVAVENEPGVIPILCKAGDAVFFTEACRHGGIPLRSKQTRYTLHVGYGPTFLRSQNISTMDEEQNVTDDLLKRLTPAQRDLLVMTQRTPIS